MNRFRSLRVRLALAVAGLLALILVVFGLFVYASLAQSLNAARDSALALSAAQAVAAVNYENGAVNFQDSVPTDEEAATLRNTGITIRVLGLDGRILEAFGPDIGLPVTDRSLTAHDPSAGVYETLTSESPSHDPVRFYTVPFLQDGQRYAYVQVGQTLEDIEDTLQRLLIVMGIGSPLLIVSIALGSYVIVSRALAPIDRITHTAGQIADSGDLSARLHLPRTTEEVDRLGETFDRMLGRLDESFQRERQFTADASHELRTPLAAMQAILNVVRSEPRSVADYERALADLADETDRLKGLIEALLSLARTDSPGSGRRERLDLSVLVNDVAESLRPLAEAKNLSLTTDLREPLPIMGDTDELIRLFVNVLDNAIHYTAAGRIQVSGRSTGRTSEIQIEDTGMGIAPEALAHIFDRFYRVESARSTRGAGLGLSLALAIAQAHGGTITAASEIGRGSTMTIALPLEAH